MSAVRWVANDGSIAHCVLIAHGRRPYETFYVYDAVGLVWGGVADVMRDHLKPTFKPFEVEFPFGDVRRKRYATLQGAKRAIERAAR